MNIVIWTGPAWEPWDAMSVHQGGIAGSETAAIYMASELHKLGHHVTVINQSPCPEAYHDGVLYLDYKTLGNALPSHPRLQKTDVFISSRDKHAHSLFHLFNPRMKILWSHDIHVGDDWEGDLTRFDFVFCVSAWALYAFRKYYPGLPLEKVVVSRNGINPDLFEPNWTVESLLEHKAMVARQNGIIFTYSSCPSRGLDTLLDMWPSIKEMLPKAQLNVYYGFNNLRAFAKNKAHFSAKADWLEKRLQEVEREIGGVKNHGRVGQAELAKAWLDTSVWLYPTHWNETSCITAMEAQVSGSLPICTKLAALAETVSEDTGFFVEPADRSQVMEGCLNKLRYAFDHPLQVEVKRSSARKRGLSLSWQQVALDWHCFFDEYLVNKTTPTLGSGEA